MFQLMVWWWSSRWTHQLRETFGVVGKRRRSSGSNAALLPVSCRCCCSSFEARVLQCAKESFEGTFGHRAQKQSKQGLPSFFTLLLLLPEAFPEFQAPSRTVVVGLSGRADYLDLHCCWRNRGQDLML